MGVNETGRLASADKAGLLSPNHHREWVYLKPPCSCRESFDARETTAAQGQLGRSRQKPPTRLVQTAFVRAIAGRTAVSGGDGGR